MNDEMIIKVDRKWKKDTYTIGRVYIDGIFFSNSLEDVDRGLDDSMSEEESGRRGITDKCGSGKELARCLSTDGGRLAKVL